MPLPFSGDLRSVTNYHRDWVIYEMELRLPTDTDMDKVRKIIERIGQDLLHDPGYGQNLLPLKSQGIHRARTSYLASPVLGSRVRPRRRQL